MLFSGQVWKSSEDDVGLEFKLYYLSPNSTQILRNVTWGNVKLLPEN